MIGLTGVLLRQVPAELVAGVQAGELQVLGSIVRSVTSGRIVGHLQETSLLGQLIAQVPSAPIGLLGDAVAIAQNEQIKSALAVVQSLQMTNTVLSAASIGVSVAGTALLLRKLASLESKVDALEPQLAQIGKDVRALRRDRIAEDFTRPTTLVTQLDECWNLANPVAEWRDIARDAHFLADNFCRRARELGQEVTDPLVAIPFVEAFALASSTRVTARLASDDKAAAGEAARSCAETLIELGSGLQLGSLVLSRATGHDGDLGTPQWTTRIDQIEQELRPIVARVRQQEAAAAASMATIAHLKSREISGREWLAAARAEEDSPLLYLPVGDGRATS